MHNYVLDCKVQKEEAEAMDERGMAKPKHGQT
jgi:hypothetical protein